MEHALFPADLEIRRRGGRSSFRGHFPYKKRAVIADRGQVRKESFWSKAFSYSVENKDREVFLLSGHNYNFPLAKKSNGTLELTDSDNALTFRAQLPKDEASWPSWMRDAVLLVESGLAGGISPGFVVPPKSVVPNAMKLVPEKGNPGVYERRIYDARLTELSIVSIPSYKETGIDVRSMTEPEPDPELDNMRELAIWL